MNHATDAELVSIIIPVHNEARFLELVVRTVTASPINKEIVIVNDGSTDDSGAMLDRLQEELSLTVLTHPRCLGKGSAIRTGIAASHGSIILIQDADLEYDPEDYPTLLGPLLKGRASIVYGSRFLRAHRVSDVWYRAGNWIITMLVNLLFNASLTDVETGYKAFRRDVLNGLQLRAMGFEFEIELTCRLLRSGQSICEMPIAYDDRTHAEEKNITWIDGVYALWVILRCRLTPASMRAAAQAPLEPVEPAAQCVARQPLQDAVEELHSTY